MSQEKKYNGRTEEENDYASQFFSPIPMHLSPEERVIWEKEYEWQKQEYERRKKAGLYGSTKKAKDKTVSKNTTGPK